MYSLSYCNGPGFLPSLNDTFRIFKMLIYFRFGDTLVVCHMVMCYTFPVLGKHKREMYHRWVHTVGTTVYFTTFYAPRWRYCPWPCDFLSARPTPPTRTALVSVGVPVCLVWVRFLPNGTKRSLVRKLIRTVVRKSCIQRWRRNHF